jgi:carbonic anhydrase/acetyltransferase-like protein (isoleucine patch superfamily)
MNAYMVESDRKIEPFGDHPRECLIGNRKLGDIQRDVLQSLGITLKTASSVSQVKDSGEHIIFDDRLFFSKELLKEFVRESRRLRQATICAIPPLHLDGVFCKVLATQDVRVYSDRVEYDLHYVPAASSWHRPLPILIEVENYFVSVPLPEHTFGCSEYRIPITDKIIVNIDHWVNLHNANIAMTSVRPTILGSRLKVLTTALKARSLNQSKLVHHINKIGKNCSIHPTAWVEFSILGDNVRVGAGSVLSGALIGDNSSIGNKVTIEFSVVGERCAIGSGASIRFATLYPRTLTMANLIQYSLCGKDAFLGDGVTLCDYRIDGKCIAVMKNGTLIDTNSRVIGACLGHGVYLGAGCIVEPGRAVPNGMHLAPDQSRLINRFDSNGNVPGYRKINTQALH